MNSQLTTHTPHPLASTAVIVLKFTNNTHVVVVVALACVMCYAICSVIGQMAPKTNLQVNKNVLKRRKTVGERVSPTSDCLLGIKDEILSIA